MYVACCCCAAAADVDPSNSAYPLVVLLLLRPRLILPYLHLSPIAGIRVATAEHDVPVSIQSASAALCAAILLLMLLLDAAVRHRTPATRGCS